MRQVCSDLLPPSGILQCLTKLEASSRLIDELKAELATQATQLRQGEEVLQQLENSEARCKDLQSSLTKSKGALDEARAEIKTLTTKLSAFRSAEATGKGPGSARKAGPGAHRAAPADVVQAGQAKEDLYGDLTGLILRGVQLGESEDVFDCIQTGRNGSTLPSIRGGTRFSIFRTFLTDLTAQLYISNSAWTRPNPQTTTRMSSSLIGPSWTRTGTGISWKSYRTTWSKR